MLPCLQKTAQGRNSNMQTSARAPPPKRRVGKGAYDRAACSHASRAGRWRKSTRAALIPSGAQPYLVGSCRHRRPRRLACWQGDVHAAGRKQRQPLPDWRNWTEDRSLNTLAGRGLLARLAPAAAGGPRMRRDPAFDAPWMRQPPPRPAPGQRAAARAERAAVSCLQGGAAEGAQGDSTRGLGGIPGTPCSEDKGQPCRGAF